MKFLSISYESQASDSTAVGLVTLKALGVGVWVRSDASSDGACADVPLLELDLSLASRRFGGGQRQPGKGSCCYPLNTEATRTHPEPLSSRDQHGRLRFGARGPAGLFRTVRWTRAPTDPAAWSAPALELVLESAGRWSRKCLWKYGRRGASLSFWRTSLSALVLETKLGMREDVPSGALRISLDIKPKC